MEFLFDLSKSLHYLRANNTVVLAVYNFPAVVDLQLMVPFNQVNSATLIWRTIADAHEVTILEAIYISFKLGRVEKTNDERGQVTLWDENIDWKSVTSYLQPQYPWV